MALEAGFCHVPGEFLVPFCYFISCHLVMYEKRVVYFLIFLFSFEGDWMFIVSKGGI